MIAHIVVVLTDETQSTRGVGTQSTRGVGSRIVAFALLALLQVTEMHRAVGGHGESGISREGLCPPMYVRNIILSLNSTVLEGQEFSLEIPS